MRFSNFKPFNLIQKDNLSTILVYTSVRTKGVNYDPERGGGYTEVMQSPVPIKALVYDASPTGLIVREIGLKNIGSKEAIIQAKHVDLIKRATKLVIGKDEYSCYTEALGNRALITKLAHSMYRVTLFAKQ